jgi:hypothetical protein
LWTSDWHQNNTLDGMSLLYYNWLQLFYPFFECYINFILKIHSMDKE